MGLFARSIHTYLNLQFAHSIYTLLSWFIALHQSFALFFLLYSTFCTLFLPTFTSVSHTNTHSIANNNYFLWINKVIWRHAPLRHFRYHRISTFRCISPCDTFERYLFNLNTATSIVSLHSQHNSPHGADTFNSFLSTRQLIPRPHADFRTHAKHAHGTFYCFARLLLLRTHTTRIVTISVRFLCHTALVR